MCCKTFYASIYIILKELMDFFNLCIWRVFQGFILSHMVEWFMCLIFYEIHMCIDLLIKVLSFKYLHICSKYLHGIRAYRVKELSFVQQTRAYMILRSWEKFDSHDINLHSTRIPSWRNFQLPHKEGKGIGNIGGIWPRWDRVHSGGGSYIQLGSIIFKKNKYF